MMFPSQIRLRKSSSRRNGSRRPVPRLEVLEDRTLPSTLAVISADEDGSAGTLRGMLAASKSGDTIRFAHQLTGDTITLTVGELAVNQSLDIEGWGADKLAISGSGANRSFDVASGTTLRIAGHMLARGLHLARDASAALTDSGDHCP